MRIQRLFAKDGDNDSRRERLIGGGSVLGGAGAIIGSEEIGGRLHNGIAKDFKASGRYGSEGDALIEKLRGVAKNQGTKIVYDPFLDNSAYVGAKGGQRVRDQIASLKKKFRATGNQKYAEMAEALEEGIQKKIGGGAIYKNLGKDTVVIGLGKDNPAVLAHELGHSKYMRNGRTKDFVGKAAHKLIVPSKLATSSVGSAALAGAGFRRGKNSVTTDEEGNIKVNKKKALKSAALGTLAVSPLLIAEGAASRKGLKMLKNAGASKEAMKLARKDLARAWGTYAAASAGAPISELVGHGVGVAYGISREKKRRKMKDENK